MIRTRFDLLAPLPCGRTVIEASAGTGKTYSLTGLIVRYIAESNIAIDQFLVVTFTRAAANDLRDRTREVLGLALQVTASGVVPDNHPWMAVLLDATRPSEMADRYRRLSDAVNRFDELTITTIHGFCQQALAQLGVRAGTDPDAVLVENTHDIVAEVCRDLIITELADAPTLLDSPTGSDRKVRTPAQAETHLIANVSTLIANPGAVVAPCLPHPDAGPVNCGPANRDTVTGEPSRSDPSKTDPSKTDMANEVMASRWLRLTRAALEAVVERRRARSEIGYDTLISGLRDALADPLSGGAVAEQMAGRSSVVLVDEFQDTDRVQWEVFQRAFANQTLITVGDPKQAIYRFRGADVHAYLDAVETVPVLTLPVNYRSDQQLLEGLERLLSGATLGDPRIQFHPVEARPMAPINALGNRSGAGASAAVHLRVAPLDDSLRAGQKKDLSMPLVRTLVLADLIQRTVDLLDNGVITDTAGSEHAGRQRAVQPGDIAVLVPSHSEANNVAEAMRRSRIPAVRTRTGSVLQTPAATQWRLLLAALAEPHRAPAVRAAALGWFLPTDIVALAESDVVLVELQERVAEMADRMRLIGLSAFYDEQKSLSPSRIWGAGVLRSVLGRDGGDRHLTDLDHIAELVAEAMQGHTCDPAQVLRTLDELISGTDERSEASMRRIDSDALAVQITTIHSAKGLEYPIVLVPFGFKKRASLDLPYAYTGPDGQRTLDIASTVAWDAGPTLAGDETTRYNQEARKQWANVDTEGDELRLLYVALTRAKHRVEVWWACTQRASGSALGRILLDRDGCGPIRNTATRFEPRLTATRRPSKGFGVKRPPYLDTSEPDMLAQLHRLAAESEGSIEITELPARIVAPVWSNSSGAQVHGLRTASSPNRRTVGDPTWKRWSFSRLGAQLDAAADGFAAESAHDLTPTVDLDASGYDEPADPADDLIGEDGAASDEVNTTEQLRLWPAVGGLEPIASLADVAGGTRFGTFVHAVLENLDFGAAELAVQVRSLVVAQARRDGLEIPVDDVVAGLLAALHTPLGPLFDGRSLAEIPASDRLAELTFDLPLLGGRNSAGQNPRGQNPGSQDPGSQNPGGQNRGRRTSGDRLAAGAIGEILLSTLARRDPMRPFAAQLAGEMAGLDIAGWMHGSIDAVFRIADTHNDSGYRYLVVDYKTNRLHQSGAADPVGAYRPDRLVPAMEHSRYPLQALLYTVALHRYLRWRLGDSYSPEHHLGGVGYLFVRGMVGPDTPTVGGVAHGVFSWRPPTAAVLGIDHLFATGRHDPGGRR